MRQYHYRKKFDNQIFTVKALDFADYEDCHFKDCDLSACEMTAVVFIDCIFEDCRFDGTQLNHSALRKVHFLRCYLGEVNFVMTERLLFEISFSHCVLDFSKFYTMKLKGTRFSDCRLLAVDFMQADLTKAIFERCDLYRCEFDKANARQADFLSSRNFTIDPESCQLERAQFAISGLPGLLFKHQIVAS